MDITEEALQYRTILSHVISATVRVPIPATPGSARKMDGVYWTKDRLKNQYYSSWRGLLWCFHHFPPRPPALHVLYDDGEPFLIYGGMYNDGTFDQEFAVLYSAIQKQVCVASTRENEHIASVYQTRRDALLADICVRTR